MKSVYPLKKIHMCWMTLEQRSMKRSSVTFWRKKTTSCGQLLTLFQSLVSGHLIKLYFARLQYYRVTIEMDFTKQKWLVLTNILFKFNLFSLAEFAFHCFQNRSIYLLLYETGRLIRILTWALSYRLVDYLSWTKLLKCGHINHKNWL